MDQDAAQAGSVSRIVDSDTKAWDRIVKYDKEMDISEFICGNNEMDLWFRQDAFEWHQHKSARCTSPWMRKTVSWAFTR